MAAGRLLLNSLVVFAPQRAFDERSDIFYLPCDPERKQRPGLNTMFACVTALEENDSDAQLFLARMNERTPRPPSSSGLTIRISTTWQWMSVNPAC